MSHDITKKEFMNKFSLKTVFNSHRSDGMPFITEKFVKIDEEGETEIECLEEAYKSFIAVNLSNADCLFKKSRTFHNRRICFFFDNLGLYQHAKENIEQHRADYKKCIENSALTMDDFLKIVKQEKIADDIRISSELSIGDSCYYLSGTEDHNHNYIYNLEIKKLDIKDVAVYKKSSTSPYFYLHFHLSNARSLDTEKLIKGTDEIDTGYANTFMFLSRKSAAKRKNEIIDKLILLNPKEEV
jgi:hypothetical protein